MASTADKERMERAARVEKAASDAVALIERFSEMDVTDPDPTNPWKNPDNIWEQLDQARDNLMAACGPTPDSQQDEGDGDTQQDSEADQKAAHTAMYIDLITDSFADVLEEMRKTDQVDVDILVDCLQSGLELLSTEELQVMMMDQEDSVPDENATTPHEQRRRHLGFHVKQEAK